MANPTSNEESSFAFRFAKMWHDLIGSPVMNTRRYTEAQGMMEEADAEITRLRTEHENFVLKVTERLRGSPVETKKDDTEDMANIGRALMERLPKDYHWNDCPTEIVTDLLNQIHDLKQPSVVETSAVRAGVSVKDPTPPQEIILCAAMGPSGFICERPKGHPGRHCDGDNRRWDAEKAPVTSAETCPTGDWVHAENNGKCIYCGAPMPSEKASAPCEFHGCSRTDEHSHVHRPTESVGPDAEFD